MQTMGHMLLTALCALAVGLLLDRLHLPGGMMIGAVIGACALGILSQAAYMPPLAKTTAQIIAGAFIGSGIRREDVAAMRNIVRPALILIPCLLAVNIAAGYLVYRTSSMDLLTALICCAPGGLSDMPMIGADLGADPSMVVVMQFVRMSMGIGAFPLMIRAVAGGRGQAEAAETRSHVSAQKYRPQYVLMTFGVAAVCGLLGKVLPVPAGTMGFATLGSICYSCCTGHGEMPPIFRKAAQLMAGAYVGASVGAEQLSMLKTLGVPVLILITAYVLACFGIGFLLYRAKYFNYEEAMLAATPAGASDMALISADLGIHNIQLIVLQVLRLIVVVLVFPAILNLVASLF